MNSLEFQKQYKSLNLSQKLAVDSIEGAVMVVAGPGTGKTKTLTLRIANILLKTQINPENILALTFTEAASYEMRKRLLSIIGQDAYRVEITTFHSFANNFIKMHQEEFSEIISSDNITEIEQISILEEIIKKEKLVHIKPLGDLLHYVKPSLSAINKLKMEKISPSHLEKSLDTMKKDLESREDLLNTTGIYKGKIKSKYLKKFSEIEKNRELGIVYEKYQEKLKEKKFYDYSDMLLELIKKLEVHPYLLQYIQEKYQYFLVDEHQDTNSAQNTLVEMMASFFPNPNLFVVGDEKQAIYRFQGASLKNFLYFKKKYPEAVLINLSENYRSTQTILDATFSLISNNSATSEILSETAGLLKKSEHAEEKIKRLEFNSYDSEYYWIAERVSELLKKTNGNDIAILVRNNADINPLAPIFDSYKIPYMVESDNDVLEDLDVGKMIIILRSVEKPTSNEYILKSMLMDNFDLNPLDVFKISNYRHENKNNIWEVLNDIRLLESFNLQDVNSIKRFVNLYTNKKNGFIALANNSRLDEVFVSIFNNSNLIKKILEKPNSKEILMRFARLYDEVKEMVGRNASYSLTDFISYIDLLEEHKIALKKNTHVVPDGVVRLMTVHKSKGLEFDYVLVPQVYDKHWGNKKKGGARFNIPWEYLEQDVESEIEDENSDERRLFYVALTRARKNIFISYSNSSEDGREQIASQFLTEISEEFVEDVDVKEFENRFNNNLENIFKPITKNKDLSFSKEFVAEVFRRQGLSVSGLNNYLQCPWKYFFLNLIRIPERIEDAGLFGNAIHEAINRYVVKLKKGEDSKDFLIKAFKESNYLKGITANELPRFIERGEKALEGFYEERLKFISKDSQTELDIKGIRINDDLFLNGKIDMIEPLEKTGKVAVYDFKTGGVKSRNVIEGKTKDSDGNYKRQLVFYKILLDRYRNGFFKMVNGVIEFVEPNDSGKYKREVFDITEDESKELLEQAIEISREIISLIFWNQRCEDKKCEYCRLRDYIAS